MSCVGLFIGEDYQIISKSFSAESMLCFAYHYNMKHLDNEELVYPDLELRRRWIYKHRKIKCVDKVQILCADMRAWCFSLTQ